MLTKFDLCERLTLDIEDVAYMFAKKILPEPISVGGEYRWRVEDIELFEDYLRARHECVEHGQDPDAPEGPAVPVYSMGLPRFDPREATARIRERERREKSKTLAAGTKPIAVEKPATIPSAANTVKVEGK